jgi:hydroxypyruvate reductase
MIDRRIAEAVLGDAIAACDPAARVRDALDQPVVAERLAGRRRLGLAIGKAALAMARGAGPVAAGIAIVPRGGAGELPGGWQVREAAHPEPDADSLAAGRAALGLVQSARASDAVLALLSGGASALAELPIDGLGEPDRPGGRGGQTGFDQLVATVRGVMAAGAPIDEINTVRGALSAIKAGQLALASLAPVVTLAVSDVIGDPLAVIGSGPTVGPWLAAPGVAVDDGAAARRARAVQILARYGLAIPAALSAPAAPHPRGPVVRRDHAEIVAPMVSCARAAVRALADRGIAAALIDEPIAGELEAVARALAGRADPVLVAWGEPTLRVPAVHGTGGRAQQLALVLARWLRGAPRSAFVVGSDGVDGPAPRDRPAPAGAWVDGTTWDAIAAAGLDPADALARCDAGSALAAVGALVVTGPTGINHADLVILG